MLLALASCYLPSFLQEHTVPAQCNVCTRLTKDQESKSIVADVPQLPGCQCGALSLTGKTNSGQITAGQDWLRFALPSTNPLHQCTGSTRTRADKLSRGGAGVVLQPTCCKQVMQGAVVASWLGGFETILQIPEDPTTNEGWRNLPAENAFHVFWPYHCHYVRDSRQRQSRNSTLEGTKSLRKKNKDKP